MYVILRLLRIIVIVIIIINMSKNDSINIHYATQLPLVLAYKKNEKQQRIKWNKRFGRKHESILD